MSGKTKIQWTEETWNPVRGCERVSEGCRHCYAEVMAARFSEPGLWGHGIATWVRRPVTGQPEARWTGKIVPQPEALDYPMRRRKPTMIFVNSTSDLFHERVPFDFIDQVFAVMALTPQNTYQVLTKRPEVMLRYFMAGRISDRQVKISGAGHAICDRVGATIEQRARLVHLRLPFPNVWLGVSTEDQKTFDQRVEVLAGVPAAVRWVSAEPLLSEIEFGNAFDTFEESPGAYRNGVLHWVVIGGESGRDARMFDPEWAKWMVRDCKLAKVPVFVKQMGSNARGLELKHPKGGDMAEWPADLRVREYPNVG